MKMGEGSAEKYIIRRCCGNCYNMVEDGDARETWLRCTEHIMWTIRRDGYCEDHDWNEQIKHDMNVVSSYED